MFTQLESIFMNKLIEKIINTPEGLEMVKTINKEFKMLSRVNERIQPFDRSKVFSVSTPTGKSLRSLERSTQFKSSMVTWPVSTFSKSSADNCFKSKLFYIDDVDRT